MSDMSCVYEMNMLEENEQMEKDLLSGRGMDVLFCLMDNLKTKQEISRKLGMPNYSTQLYLQRLVNAGMVREQELPSRNGVIEKEYYLVSDEIDIINRLQGNANPGSKIKTDIAAQHFAVMTKNAIRNVGQNVEKPNRIKAYFMKAKEDDMEKFREEIDQLFEKYQKLEDLEEKETYSLFTVLAPYELEDK